MRKQGCRAVALSLKREEELWNRDEEQFIELEVRRRVEGTRMQNSCLE